MMFSKKLLTDTIAEWQSITPHELNNNDAREILTNMTELLLLLLELDEKYNSQHTGKNYSKAFKIVSKT